MKIRIDSTWQTITNADTGDDLLTMGVHWNPEWEPLMQSILTETQYANYVERDGTHKLSKKREQILMEYINARKGSGG